MEENTEGQVADDKKVQKAESNQHEIKCAGCSADLEFKPGTTNLHCQYCGAENEIEIEDIEITENDYLATLKKTGGGAPTQEVTIVECNGCSAETTFDPKVSSDQCPYCGAPIVIRDAHSETLIRAESLLPFGVNEKEAFDTFKTWLNKLWWAPNDLKKYATQKELFVGMYMPYWTYDADTYSAYTGLRGDNYTESYTVTINGQTQTRTRVKTRWSPAAGNVHVNFDDTLVRASDSLPIKLLHKIEPFDLENLVPYNDKFITGFRTEKYQIGLEDGFEMAKTKMKPQITSAAKRDIGGDMQKVTTLNSKYENITFKHVLLPVWISSYMYEQKTYRFLINARTGKVQGERPYSKIKIAMAIIGGLIVIGTVVGLIMAYN